MYEFEFVNELEIELKHVNLDTFQKIEKKLFLKSN